MNSIHLDATSLTIDKAATLEDWLAAGAQLKRYQVGIQFWLGDWMIAGEQYGERIWQDIHELGFADGTLLNYASICRQIPRERRRAELEFTHHKLVAYLPQKEADKLLESAAREDWSTRQLQEETKKLAGGAPKDSEIKPAESESQGPPSAELWDLCLALVTARNERSEVRYNLARKLRDQLNEYLESFE